MAKQRLIAVAAAIVVVGAAGYMAFGPGAGKKPVAVVKPAELESPEHIFATQGKLGLQSAVEQFKRIVDETPDQMTAWTNLGKSLLLLGQVDEAEKVLTQALDRCVKGGAAIGEKDVADVRVALGEALLAKFNFARAQTLAEEALKVNARDGTAHSVLARALYHQGHMTAAEKHYDMAAVLQPGNAEIYWNWGTMLYEQNEARAAEDKFRQAIAARKDDPKYYVWLGRALRRQGRYGPALKAEEDAHDLNPQMADPWLELGSISMDLKDFGKAENCFRAALGVDRGSLDGKVNLARVLIVTNDPAQRDFLQAAMLLGEAVDITHGKNINLLSQQAAAYALGKYYEQASEVMEKAIAQSKAQNIPLAEREFLLENAQDYAYKQKQQELAESGAVPAAVSTPEGVGPMALTTGGTKPADDPFDLPEEPRTRAPDARVIAPGHLGAPGQR